MTFVVEMIAIKLIASIALLSLPAALAAIVQEYPDSSPDTTPSRPNTALLIPEPTAPPEQPLHLQRRNPSPTPTTVILSSSSSSSAPAGGSSETELGVFTADGIPYTVTSVTGIEKVDGKTLTPGAAPVNIGGVDVIERGGGALVANGATIKFHPYTASSSLPGGVPGNSESSAASSTAASSSSSASGNAAMPTAGPGGMAALGVGAVVGGFML